MQRIETRGRFELLLVRSAILMRMAELQKELPQDIQRLKKLDKAQRTLKMQLEGR